MRNHFKTHDDINDLFWVLVETQELRYTQDENEGKDNYPCDESLLVRLHYAEEIPSGSSYLLGRVLCLAFLVVSGEGLVEQMVAIL